MGLFELGLGTSETNLDKDSEQQLPQSGKSQYDLGCLWLLKS